MARPDLIPSSIYLFIASSPGHSCLSMLQYYTRATLKGGSGMAWGQGYWLPSSIYSFSETDKLLHDHCVDLQWSHNYNNLSTVTLPTPPSVIIMTQNPTLTFCQATIDLIYHIGMFIIALEKPWKNALPSQLSSAMEMHVPPFNTVYQAMPCHSMSWTKLWP